MRSILFALIVAAASQGLPERQAPPQDRLVGADSQVRLPPTTRNIAESLASIARASGVLIGFETVTDVDRGYFPSQIGWSPRGLLVSQALDQLTALDPRYDWREVNGVIHFRPRTAFTDPDHFLNRHVPAFELKDALPLHATFEVHRIFRPDCVIRHPIYSRDRDEYLAEEPPPLRKPLTVSFKGGTVLDLMDAIIKAHGALHWAVHYDIPPDRPPDASARYEDAIFGFTAFPQVGGWWRMCVGDADR